MGSRLSYDLHALTARLDRAADRILRAEIGVPYRRFLALSIVSELGAATQRALAERLGVTEPSVSRMTGVLVQDGLLDASADPAGGNRRRLSLTAAGRSTVDRCSAILDGRFDALAQRSGIPFDEYGHHTALLLATLDSEDHT